MRYFWKITKVHLDSLKDEVGVSNAFLNDGTDSIKDNPSRFSMYDDDDNCYYEGMIYGEYDGFEPLYNFGMPNAGCTYIKINGKIL
jgi:hypothetical protein